MANRNRLIYVAGKYSGDVDANITAARRAAIALVKAGFTPICPHLNNAHFETEPELEAINYSDFIESDLNIISRCDAIFFLREWGLSPGAIIEITFSNIISIPEFFESDPIEESIGDLINYFNQSGVCNFVKIDLEVNTSQMIKDFIATQGINR
jgi:hypothetical protein